MMNCFCSNHASGILRDSFVVFFQEKIEQILGRGMYLEPLMCYHDHL